MNQDRNRIWLANLFLVVSLPGDLGSSFRVPLKHPDPAPGQVPDERGAVSVVWVWAPKVLKEKSHCMGTVLQL